MSEPVRYPGWAEVPAGLRTANDLRFAGLEPRGDPVALLVLDGREVPLHREAEAVPRAIGPTPVARGSVDPSRTAVPSAAPANPGWGRGARRGRTVESGTGSLHRSTVRTDTDPASGVAAAIAWVRDLLLDDFVVIDTETTGLGYRDEVIEIGVVAPDGATLLSSLVRPRSGRVPAAVSAVHGITTADLADAPPFDEVYAAMREAIGNRRVVAWNAPFDERMVRQSAAAWGRRERVRGFECAMRAYALSRGLRHGRAKLERAAIETGVLRAGRQAHRSCDDALLTLQVLMRVAGAGGR